MGKAVTYFSVKGGLNTEASPLNIPPEDCVDILNCNLNIDGSVERRAGIDFVAGNGGNKTAIGFSTGNPQNAYVCTTNSHITISDIQYNKFLFVKSGRIVNVFAYTSVADLETATPFQSILLEAGTHIYYKTTFASFGDTIVLINETMPLVYLKILGNAFVIERDGIYVRDFPKILPAPDSVVSVGLKAYRCVRSHYPEDTRTRPEFGTDWKKYWLYVGPKDAETAWAASNTTNYTYVRYGYHPLNGYYVYRALAESLAIEPTITTNWQSYWEYVGTWGNDPGAWSSATTYPAPTGDPLPAVFVSQAVSYNGITMYEEYYAKAASTNKEPGVASDWRTYWEYTGIFSDTYKAAWSYATPYAIPTLTPYIANTVQTTTLYDSGFTTGCFSTGRFWIGGILKRRNSVFVSQAIISEMEFNRMYQSADPHSTTDTTIVDSDGAEIVLVGAININNIVPYNFGVLVFAENGVWYIGGADGFKTTAITTQKISDVGTDGVGAVASVESGIVFFGTNGIYGIKESAAGSGYPVAQDIGAKIQSLYVAIPSTARRNAETLFDPLNKRLYYFHHSGAAKTYNRCLVLDMRVGMWFKHSVDSTVSAVISHFIATPNVSTESELIFVIQKAGNYWGFGRFTSGVWSDFTGTTAEKKTYESYITMAHQTYGTVIRKREATYLTTVFERLEPTYDGSCKMRVDWNWARTSASPYFGTARQVYFPNKYITSLYNDTLNGLETVVSKHKVRGWGNVFRFHFESEGDMPFKLLGWELLVEVDPTP